eukprot:653123-Rhodomonas_salina.2
MDNLNLMAMPESLNDSSKLIKSETILKLKSDGTWIPRVMTLTTELLAFTNDGEGPIVDYIPLEEISKVDQSHRQVQNLESFEGVQSKEKSHKSKSRNISPGALRVRYAMTDTERIYAATSTWQRPPRARTS